MSKNVKTRQDTDKMLHADDNIYKFSPIASFPGPPFQLPTQTSFAPTYSGKASQSRTAA